MVGVFIFVLALKQSNKAVGRYQSVEGNDCRDKAGYNLTAPTVISNKQLDKAF